MNNFNIDKEIRDILRKYDPSYRAEIIRVNISSSFISRARCAKCGKHPDYYYYVRKPYLWKTIGLHIASSKWFRKWISRMTADWYLDGAPKNFPDIKEFSFTLEDKHYLPTLYRVRGTPARDDQNVVEMAGCSCGGTLWAFNNKSVKDRQEITNRKGRYSYPQKFEY